MIGDAWTPPVIVTIDDERANASEVPPLVGSCALLVNQACDTVTS